MMCNLEILKLQIKQSPMNNRSAVSSQRQSKSRDFLCLPNKLLFISTFFNQKLSKDVQRGHSYISNLSPLSPPQRKIRPQALGSPPKYQLNSSKLFFNLNKPIRSKNKFRRTIKFHIPSRNDQKVKQQNAKRIILENKSTFKQQGPDRQTFDNKKSVLLGSQHHEIIKKQLQDKFLKTRMNILQKQKQETENQFVKLTPKKSGGIRTIHKSENTNKALSENQSFEPWVKQKISRNSYYDPQQNDENGGYF